VRSIVQRMLRTIVLVLAFGLVVPSIGGADWSRKQLPDGSQVCQDADTGVTFKPPYSAKADVTKACNTLTSFLPWLGTAEAAPVLSHTLVNPDGSHSTAYPNDGKAPTAATLAWDDACLTAALAIIASQSTGTATDINLSSCKTGTNAGSATIALHTAVTGWSIGGSGSTHLLNSGASTGSSGVSGAIVLDLTAAAQTDTSAAFPWAYVSPPAADTLAPPIPKNLTATPGTGTIVLAGDVPWDACGNANCTGTQHIKIQRDGSGTLATVSAGPGINCNPTSTNIGTATSVSATQSGNDWTIASNGVNDGTADQYEYVNCPSSGAGEVDAIVDSFSGSSSDVRHACVEHRAQQSVAGSITVRACILQDIGGGTSYFGASRRTSVGAATVNGNFVQVTVPVCIRLAWDAANLHTASFATVTGGKCNNDWAVQYTATVAMTGTTYAGWHVTSNNAGGSSSTAVLKQVNFNNLSWTYTDTTATSHTYAALADDRQGTPNASAYSATVSASPLGSGTSAIKFQPGWVGAYNKQCIPKTGVYGCNAADLLSVISTEICPNANLVGLKIWALPSFVFGDTAGSYTGTDRGFAVLDPVIAALHACGKVLILRVNATFFGGDQSSTPLAYPAFTYPSSFASGGTATGGAYGVVLNTQPSQPGVTAKLWQSDWRDLSVAIATAYCNRYDSDSSFYMVGFNYANLSLPMAGGDYDVGTFNSYYRQYLTSIRSVCPTTNIMALLDFTTPYPAEMSTWLTTLQAIHGTVENSDVLPEGASWGQAVYSGMTGSPSAVDYRGVVRYVEEVESVEMCGYKGSNTPTTLFGIMQNGNAGARARWPNNIVVTMANECDPTYGWAAWKTFIAGKSGQIMNARDSTLRTPAAVRTGYCESSMTCP
jgi:hypothetical protein